VAVWQEDSVAVWQEDSVAVWQEDSVAVWQEDSGCVCASHADTARTMKSHDISHRTSHKMQCYPPLIHGDVIYKYRTSYATSPNIDITLTELLFLSFPFLSSFLFFSFHRHGASGKGNALRNWELRAREVRTLQYVHGVVSHSIVQYCMVDSVVRYSVVRYSAVLRTVQYSIVKSFNGEA
jgi:hypothetical protein